MRITCDNCSKELELPDEKVPDRAFSVACPSCSHRIVVDPDAGPEGATEEAVSEGIEEAQIPVRGRLTPLRSTDVALLENQPPIAFVAHQDVEPSPRVTRELQRIGMQEVRDFGDLQEACDFLLESEAAVLLVRMAKASAPPCEPLTPIYRLPLDVRRQVLVALMADNVKSLDGQVAFYLQVNCLLSAREMDTMAADLRRALIYHLRLYRHWNVEA